MTRSLALTALIACSGGPSGDPDGGDTDTTPTDEPEDTSDIDTGGFAGPWVETADNGDGTFTTTIVAISTTDWIWFSFQSGEVAVGPDDPGGAWDLAFRREVVHVNGGDSGSGTVEVARLDRVDLDEVRWAPVAGWTVDSSDDADGNGEPDWAMYSWFDYDYDTHKLRVADRSWVIRTPDGDVRLHYDDYYNPADSNSGYPKFTWAWLADEPNPLSTDGTSWTVDPSKGPVHLSLRGAAAIAPVQPDASDGWDLALDGTGATLNATGGALTAASVAAPYDKVSAPPAKGFGPTLDASQDATWVIARPDGTHDKLRFATPTELRTAPL